MKMRRLTSPCAVSTNGCPSVVMVVPSLSYWFLTPPLAPWGSASNGTAALVRAPGMAITTGHGAPARAAAASRWRRAGQPPTAAGLDAAALLPVSVAGGCPAVTRSARGRTPITCAGEVPPRPPPRPADRPLDLQHRARFLVGPVAPTIG